MDSRTRVSPPSATRRPESWRPESWWPDPRVVALILALVAVRLLGSLWTESAGLAQEPPAAERGPADLPPGPAAEDGLFVTVSHPITTAVMVRVQQTVEWARRRPGHKPHKVIFDFNPGNHPCGTALYGPCYDLAKYILSVTDMTTVAYVHHEVSRHTLLPVLACNELVMSSDGRLGNNSTDPLEPLAEDQANFYDRLALDRRRSPALVLKMFRKDIEVMEGRTPDGAAWYFDRREQADAVKRGIVLARPEPVIPAGVFGLYGRDDARAYRLCEPKPAETRQQVAESYRLGADSLREDQLQGRTPKGSLIHVTQPFTPAEHDALLRRIRREIARRANVIFLEINTVSGDASLARDFAGELRGLRDDTGDAPVLTVAYLPERAAEASTFIALGCSEIVMAKNAVLGDFESAVTQRQGGVVRDLPPDQIRPRRDMLVALAQEQGYPALVFRGMLDRELTVYRARSQKGPAERRLLSEEDLEQDRAGENRWQVEGQLKPGGPRGQLLKLTTPLALDLGIARHQADSLAELYTAYGIDDPAAVHESRSDWLEGLAAALRHPLVSVLLVMIGLGCLILELKAPGLSLPGIVAVLCFILFFWSHFDLAGRIVWLAVMLFLLGLVLIGLEVFLVPGVTLFGVSGVVFVLLGLGLATLEKKPETSQEWWAFGTTLTAFGVSVVGAFVGAVLTARFLPHIPYANRLVLTPPHERTDVDDAAEQAYQAGLALLGAVGTAATPLRPAGMARFGDEFRDVVAEGGFVPEGARVRVIEIEGNRMTVKEL